MNKKQSKQTTTEPTQTPKDKLASGRQTKRRLFLLVPFILLMGFLLLSFFRIDSLEENSSADDLPNALAGKPAPVLHIPLLSLSDPSFNGAKTVFFDNASLKGHVTLVNFWGSWCPPCREEHPFLMSLADNPAFHLIGINYKDKSDNAGRFLRSFGNPFRQIGFDENGRAAIDWGVYGPPETFVLNKQGIIVYRFIGPMDAESFRQKIWPIIVRANNE